MRRDLRNIPYMLPYAFIIILFLITSFPARDASAAQLPDSLADLSAQAIFDKANIQFELKKYDVAIKIYQAIEKKHRASGPLYLNMAIAYTNIDSMGLAKYYFIKASDFPETQSQAQNGLNYVNNQLSHKSAVLPELPWDRAMNWIQNEFGIHSLMFWSLIILNLGVIALISIWFVDKFRKPLKYIGILLVSLGVLSVITSKLVDYHAQRYSKGVMITTQTNVMEKPRKESDVVSIAYEGYTFTIDNEKSHQNPSWYYIRMSNGLYGWIPKRDIKVL